MPPPSYPPSKFALPQGNTAVQPKSASARAVPPPALAPFRGQTGQAQQKAANSGRTVPPPPLAPFRHQTAAAQAKPSGGRPCVPPPPLAPMRGVAPGLQAKLPAAARAVMPPPLAPFGARTVQAAHSLDQWLLRSNTQEAIDALATQDFGANIAHAAAAEVADMVDDGAAAPAAAAAAPVVGAGVAAAAAAPAPYEYTWNGDADMTVTERATGTMVGSMELHECEDDRVWLNHIHVEAAHRRNGIAIRMITEAAARHGANLRLPGLGVAGTHQYYWHDGQGRALGAACVARGIITAAQHNDDDVPRDGNDSD